MAGALYTETLFKKGSNRFSFMEQQFWLYLYSSVVALIIHHTVYPDYGLDTAIMDVLLGKGASIYDVSSGWVEEGL